MRTTRLLFVASALAALLAAGCGKDDKPPAAGGTAPVVESFDSGTFTSGSYVHTFNNTGTFRYHCSLHGSQTGGMNGDVTVVAGTADSAIVNIVGSTFSPNLVTIHTGGYVRWVASGAAHTVTRP